MIRILFYLVCVGALMAGVGWLASRPGEVTIVWESWRIDTTAGVLAATVAVIAIVTALLYRFWRALVTAPGRFGRWRKQKRMRSGYESLTAGLVAVAAGDPAGARKHAQRADRLLDQPPLTLLLSAQAAQLAGDEATAQRHFTEMLDRPETEFLGLRGLLARALRDGDTRRALELARRARGLRPKAPWVLTTLLDLQTRALDWDGAADTLQQAEAVKALPGSELHRHQAAVLLEQSRAAVNDNRPADALRYAKRAYRAAPDHPAVPAWFAEQLLAAGKPRKAALVIEGEWARRPHPDLLPVYRRARGDGSALDWMQKVQKLADAAPAHVDSHRALGDAALEAHLWGEARKHYMAAIAAAGDAPPAALCRKMAEVEEGDSGDPALVRPWLTLAAEGYGDAAWICDACGTVHGAWRAVCGRCGAFDRLAWRAPDYVTPAAAPGTSAPPPRIESSTTAPDAPA